MDAHDNYDPEVEARLYAEIYYSNDTYPDTNNPEPSSSSSSVRNNLNIDSSNINPDLNSEPIRSYAKKTGMFPKRHRALIDGIKPTGRSRWEPMAGGNERIRRNYYDDLRPNHQFPDRDPLNPTFHVDARGSRSMPPFFDRDPRSLMPYDAPRSVPSYDHGPRSLPPYDNGHRSVPPFDYDPRSLPSYDHDPRSLPPYDRNPRSMPPFDYGPRSLPPLDYIPNSNYQYDRNFLPNPMHQNSGFNQQDYIKLSSKMKNSHRQLELKNSKPRSRKLRRDKSKKTNKPPPFKGINNNSDRSVRGNYRSPRKNPHRAARNPEFNKQTGDSSKDNDSNDSIEIIDIQEPVPDKPTAETETSCSVDASADKINDPIINDKNLEKTDDNSSKNDDNSEENDNTANKNDLDKDNSQSTSNFADDVQDLTATASENTETDKINDDDNSKYNVKCASAERSQRENSKSSESEESSDSDSDESIFEVPVPPKPPPPLINLNDSSESEDDDSDDDNKVDADAADDDKNDKKEPLTTDSLVAGSNNSKSSRENSSGTNNEKQNDSDDDDDDDEEEEEEENWIETNIILNCSQVQKSVPTMEELKKIGRESSVNLISDDSMTESEAMNWRTIEKEINTETNDELNTSMRLNISGGETNDGSDKRSPKSGGKGDKNQSPSSGSRKRAREDGGKNRDEFLKPIKLPRNEKTSEVSFEEYLAQPMPKQLLAFYTDYRDSEVMNDVRDIQSQMSSM